MNAKRIQALISILFCLQNTGDSFSTSPQLTTSATTIADEDQACDTKDTEICNSVRDGVSIAASLLGGLPQLHGPQGQPGPFGPRGPRGVSGKMGPKGDIGAPGEIGIQGVKGERGTTKMVAFSVYRSDILKVDKYIYYNLIRAIAQPAIITYDEVTINHGNAFNINTGKFRCTIPGLYFFSFSFKTVPGYSIAVNIEKNGHQESGIFVGASNVESMISHSKILDLNIGDQVWLELIGTIGSATSKMNTFNGYLILAKD